MEEFVGFIGVSCLICALFLVAIFFVPFLVMLCWNATLPMLFGTPKISFWTAFILVLLIQLLFGGIRVKTGK